MSDKIANAACFLTSFWSATAMLSTCGLRKIIHLISQYVGPEAVLRIACAYDIGFSLPHQVLAFFAIPHESAWQGGMKFPEAPTNHSLIFSLEAYGSAVDDACRPTGVGRARWRSPWSASWPTTPVGSRTPPPSSCSITWPTSRCRGPPTSPTPLTSTNWHQVRADFFRPIAGFA